MAYQSLKKNTIFNAIKTFSSIVFPLITFPYISRVLLPDNVGKINFGLSVVSYFSLLATLGITTYAIRECSVVRDNTDKLCKTASQIFSINIITTVISYILLAVTLMFYHKLDNYRVLILIQSINIVTTTLGADWLNSAMEDFKYITLRTVSFQMISLVLMFSFVHKPDDYMKYAIISLVSSAGANITNVWYRQRFCKVRFTFNIDWNKHFKPIMLLFVMLLAQTIFNSVDTTMLGIIHGDYQVGIYSTANKISSLITQLVASLLWVIMPRMSCYFAEGDYVKINQLLRKVLGFNVLVGLPLAVGTFMISNDIIRIIGGNEFYDASNVLKILMIGFVFSLFGGCFLGNAILLPSKREKEYMIVCCIAAVVNVIANFIFIPQYGAVAAAWTTTLCALVILFTLLFFIDKNIKIKNMTKLIVTPVVGCVGIVLSCWACSAISLLWIRIISSILLSTFVYFLVTYCGKNELIREIVANIVKKYRKKLL